MVDVCVTKIQMKDVDLRGEGCATPISSVAVPNTVAPTAAAQSLPRLSMGRLLAPYHLSNPPANRQPSPPFMRQPTQTEPNPTRLFFTGTKILSRLTCNALVSEKRPLVINVRFTNG